MPDPEALVFDLDGTLWDACAASALGWSRAATEQGRPRLLTPEDIGRVCGLPFDACVETLFPELGDSERKTLAPHLARGEEAAVREHGGRIYDGVVPGLRRLAERRPVLLLSNCDRWYLEIFLAQSGLEGALTDTLCHGDTGHDKAENLRLLRRRHDFDAAAYVGDTGGDRAACEAAGYEFVYAAYGFGALDFAPAFRSFEALCAALEVRVG